MRVERIGDAVLYLARCEDVLPMLPKVDAVICDPPYSERTHAGHRAGRGKDDSIRSPLGYGALSPADAASLAASYSAICAGWIVWITDHILAPVIGDALEKQGRYVFAPLPFYAPGSRVRLSGDGPSSWTCWIVVARTARQHRWGTLPGGYQTGAGWNDAACMGGKPTALMESLVRDYSRRGDLVVDSHMGAGTTGVACVRTGRRFVGIEPDPQRFNLACRRIREAHAQRPLFAPEPQRVPVQMRLDG